MKYGEALVEPELCGSSSAKASKGVIDNMVLFLPSRLSDDNPS